jgi:uncharacterized protein (DUF427 family)
MKEAWNGTVLAESDKIFVVEGNHYFPPDSVNRQYLKDSGKQVVCPCKGLASYYDVDVDGQVNPGAAWYYPSPKRAAKEIRDHVAFWRGVRVQR